MKKSKTYTRRISSGNLISAVESFLHATSTIDDNDIVIDVKPDKRSGDFFVEVETNNE